MVLADLHGAATIRSLALKLIVDNGREIVVQTEWRDKLKVYSEMIADMVYAITRLPPNKLTFSWGGVSHSVIGCACSVLSNMEQGNKTSV